MTQNLESGIYTGVVNHRRSVPKIHQFSYQIFLYWLKLKELPELSEQVASFSYEESKFKFVNFKRNDYLGDENSDLETSVIKRMNELSNEPLDGDIFLLGQVRTLGMYFSPVNFYFLRDATGVYTHMLAEVSNTPWNQRHHYLVNLSKQENSQKDFHVSPFNPMDMQYKWRIVAPSEELKLHLSCYKEVKHFEAALDMTFEPMTSKSLKRALLAIPSMTIKTLAGIYWQATKLFFKRVPIYTHS